MSVRPGDLIDIDVTNVGNGGVCIARYEGKVVLVRLALPGERVRAKVTAVNTKLLRADTVEVVRSSEYRVTPPCQVFGVCGGCDWQHATPSYQRKLKAGVVIEQMSHLGGVATANGAPLAQFVVDPIPGDIDGLRWRTRNRFHRTSSEGEASADLGLYASRSRTVVATADCLIAVPGSMEAARQALPVVTGDISTAATDDGVVVVDSRGGPIITERAAQRTWRVRASGFWQVHRGAANHFAEVVRDLAAATPGESVLDLYSGAGLFAGALAASVGPAGTITAVESVVSAVRDARRSLSDLGNIELVHADVDAWLRRHQNRKFSIVIADPPRSGLGAANVTLLSGVAQRALVYVSCEPSALARDARTLADSGWQLERLVGIDAFPMTSHVECIALFTPTRAV